MSEDADKIVEAINNLKGSIEHYQSLSQRIGDLEHRSHDLEDEMIKYRNFIEKTGGFFTRAGFYGDAAIIWLKAKFKK